MLEKLQLYIYLKRIQNLETNIKIQSNLSYKPHIGGVGSDGILLLFSSFLFILSNSSSFFIFSFSLLLFFFSLLYFLHPLIVSLSWFFFPSLFLVVSIFSIYQDLDLREMSMVYSFLSFRLLFFLPLLVFFQPLYLVDRRKDILLHKRDNLLLSFRLQNYLLTEIKKNPLC